MSLLDSVFRYFPEIRKPAQKPIFSLKIKYTLGILVAFYLLSVIPLYGLGENALAQFDQLSIILGASFGSVLSLGIGPIVTASIVLQLLVGSGILKMDQTTQEGRAYFQGLQKLLSVFFIFFEACVYVFLGGLAPSAQLIGTSAYFSLQLLLVGQLILGGLLVLLMDDVVGKYGFGSGVSLFIAAGVASQIMVTALSPLTSLGSWAFGSGQPPVGAFFVFFLSLIGGDPQTALLAMVSILATIFVFVISVYAQAMKVEIPLTFGRVRGFGFRWPLHFLYTSNIPVILVAALMANIQLWARLLQNWGYPFLGSFQGQVPVSGLVTWVAAPQLLSNILTGSLSWVSLFNNDFTHAFVYMLFLVAGSVIFSLFWVQTSGMDANSQAKKIMASGLQIPGFRKDPRVIEHLLSRYILPLTIMGGAAIGVLAATADLLGALSRGTGILLAVMIIYRLYEDIAKHHMMDLHPALRKVMGGES